MMKEVRDPHSGAILFKKDEESLTIEELSRRVDQLEKTVEDLKKCISILVKYERELS